MRIDVHAESWHVTALVAGEELFHGRIPGDYAALRKLLNRFVECQIRVAYEAGPCGFGLHDRLQADGIEVLVVPPSLVPVESGNKVKTDRRDGVGFAPAQLLDHVEHFLFGEDANVAQDEPICHFIGYDWGGCSAPEQN